ncbi:ATP-binding protein [Bacillus thermotolerans]|uniref:histidine kinase n=1 Tax=Bacillus thermotolerans TaxID=1221996 RepID=A0A0F5HMP5_BACTR|nr:ATP-binding protein [Bacillus thermotolerans]KKB34320.1 Two-component sensor histidine kinase, controling glutamine utilization [Bacillus thermotolerans]KKB37875.1 Two-component sensor histidine kinase, controling glutamine utilization [Bacillus thermotolerans]KKB39702.1 Two-component sensor histidine kinase, controling glutamine utilization [Bacillus thermotolerans]
MLSHRKLFSTDLREMDKAALILTALLTTVAGEVKVVPFEGEDFRLGLGSITFFLLILIWPPLSLVRTGIVTGITVMCFRLFKDTVIHDIPAPVSLAHEWPAFLFYFLFALGLHIVKIEKYKTLPLALGAWAFLFESIANGAEQLVRHGSLYETPLDTRQWTLLIGVALLRSYFAVGLYASITVSEQKKRMQEMLQVGSELYTETLYLQKSMNHIEQITAQSHDLYRKLKKQELHQLSVQALSIAQEIHEVKKDSQRILSGLTNITSEKKEDPMLLSYVGNLVMIANEKYSKLLKKDIAFHFHTSIDFQTDQHIPLLALLNNLTANAVEAIIEGGEVELEIFEEASYTCFIIKDSGKGLSEDEVSIIFEPGYTTKYNEQGVAATGIGLSHVKEIVQTLGGHIQVETLETGTVFRTCLPTSNIRK